MNPSSDFMVVADGGATKCAMALYSVADGKRLAETVQGPASLSLESGRAWLSIESGLRALSVRAGLGSDWQPDLLVMGLAGSERTARLDAFTRQIKHCRRYLVYSDGLAQYVGATGGAAGICLSVGTGSVVYWRTNDGALCHGGGWGFPAGDEASGAWLGLSLLTRYAQDRDKAKASDAAWPTATGVHGSLYTSLETLIGHEVADIQQWTTEKNATRLATLAPLIEQAMSAGDPVATDLVNRGTNECIRLIDLAPATLPIYLAGSVAPYYHTRLHAHYGRRLKSAVGDAMSGLYRLGCQHSEHAITR